jgi:hypothetical protein
MAGFAFGADIYVSPTGNDAAVGTPTAPLQTIAAARDKADGVKASGPVTVHLLAGTYYLNSPVVFGSSNSGTASAPITYRGEGKAVISGGIKVTTPWTTTTLNGVTVQTTKIAANLHVDQLFLNGKLQILARYPNYDYNTKILNGSASDAQTKASAAANPAEGPGYVRGIHTSSWGGNSYYFTGKTTTQWVGDNNRGSGMNSSVMAENVIEFLDAQGEWFYRKSTGDLWFYPPAGTNMNTATVELASISQLVRFTGTSGTTANSVKFITFDNVVFTHAYRSLFDSTGQFYEKVTGSDWGICRKGAVFLQNAEEITIKNCLFDHVGGNGVFMSGYNRHNVVDNNDFEGTGANCVALFGLRSSIRCPNSWSDDGQSTTGSCSNNDRLPGPLTDDYPAYCVVKNNLMDTLGTFEKQVSGVASSATQFDTIRHNTMAHMPRAGINYCDGAWGGNLVEYNWVYDVIRETGDHGPFNAWGRDRNAIYGLGDVSASLLDARNPTIVRMNRFETPDGMFGIDLDDNATNYYQEKNLIIGGGFKVQAERYNTYVNCILVTTGGGGDVQFHFLVENSHNYGARNVIVGQKSCLYQVFGSGDMTNAPTYLAQWDSNAVYSKAGAVSIATWNNCGNTIGSWGQWTGSGLDKHSITSDPGFVDTQKVFRPNYQPRGDFNPTNTAVMNSLHFQTFPMDSFGVLTTPGPDYTTSGILQRAGRDAAAFNSLSVQCLAGQLTISFDGSYDASITTVDGRALANFQATGEHRLSLDANRFRSGVYILSLRTKNGVASRRFLVSNAVP